jgi:glutaminyl-peptide cyclotransferase
MRRFIMSRCWNLRFLGTFVLVPLGLGFLAISLMNRTRTVEANEIMLESPPKIDGERAYGYLKSICEIGPRTAGSAANTRQRKLVSEHFKKMGGAVREQPFQAQHPQTGAPLVMVNLVGSWHPERLNRVVIAAHYDTRPHPDQEEDPKRRELPFIGANDGASGVALLMELAHHLDTLETPWGVDLVLFDGEELVFGNNPRVGEYFLGSIEFARIYAQQVEQRRTKMRYHAGIVLDMVGGKNLRLNQEPNSLELAPAIVGEVWSVARKLGAKSFRFQQGREVLDDHLALNQAGIRTIDIIDFDYRFWHTADDLPENCAAASLEEVGKVVTGWLMLAPRRSRR